jgi:hypothetical protein
MDPWSLGLLAWLTKKLWTPKPTHRVLGLSRPIAARILETLEPIETDTPPELAQQIQSDAHDLFWACLRERGVPDHVYELVLGDPIAGHRVWRNMDGRSWSLSEFDDFIDLGLEPRGGREV